MKKIEIKNVGRGRLQRHMWWRGKIVFNLVDILWTRVWLFLQDRTTARLPNGVFDGMNDVKDRTFTLQN